ncbi:hypothetical protein G6F68_013005 [Rhizopus microsporus]|nr:hypothetical protein G6F68_013005 [Rhizopus microsporus]
MPDRENADVDKLFAGTLVPGSRASQVVKELARAQGDTTHGEIRFVGIQRVFMAALSNSVVAGDGGVYPETQAAFKQQTLRVRYMHVDGGGRLENYFNNPEIFKPYRLPDPGVLTRDAYPFRLFEDAQGKLRLGGLPIVLALAAAQALGVDPKRCAVVEDTVTGATAGVAAGATVFGYSPDANGHSGAEALRGVGVAHGFTDMKQLPALLAGWPAGAR